MDAVIKAKIKDWSTGNFDEATRTEVAELQKANPGELADAFYKNLELDKRADQLFGEPWYERMLKDYNAQTYWLSANLRSFFPKSKIPAWLNISFGYGSEGMFGGFKNQWIDQLGNDVVRNDIPRIRQYYLAPDIDFTKIPTRSKFLKTTFAILNAFKCPAPALMIDSKGNFRAYGIYF